MKWYDGNNKNKGEGWEGRLIAPRNAALLASTMKRGLQAAIVRFLRRRGYVVIGTWRLSEFGLERHLAQLFERHGVTTVLDVGANTGQYRDFLRDCVGFSGIIHSFEPIPALAAAMRARSSADDRWFVHNLALGSETTELALNVMASDVFSSFREPDTTSTAMFSAANTVVRQEVVPVRRLDDLIPTLEGVEGGAVYLKVDTQGFDMEVIRGAPKLLSRARGLQFELAFQRIYKEVPEYLNVLKSIGDLDFDVSGFFPVTLDERMRAIELDCVMVARER